MQRFFLVIIICLGSLYASSQDRFTINGYIRDTATGETLIGATISVNGRTKTVTSNQYGFYSVTLTPGDYNIVTSFIGYKGKVLQIKLYSDTLLNIALHSATALSEEVVVTSSKKDNNVKAAQMGNISLPIDQIKSVPAFLGEVDLLKVVQLLPGVRNAGEGTSGLYVRGGGPDQNLIMLDDAIVYNTGHLFGFFSIFNSDAIKNVSLIKGGMPAQYGGRLSSVLDIAMKEGNNQNSQMEGGIGLIASRFSLQGPIKKDKASYILSARRTYVDAVAKPFISKSSQFYGSGYYFYDLNAKINYNLGKKDHVYLSGYFGRDVFDFV